MIYAFGLNNYAQLGLAGKQISVEQLFVPRPCAFKDVKSIAGGQHHTMIVTTDNKCLVVGRKEYGRLGLGEVKADVVEPTVVTTLADKTVLQISCGESCSFAVTDDGKVFAWGMASNQLGVGSDENDLQEPTVLTGVQIKDKKVIAVSGGGQHTLFLVQANNAVPTTNGHAEAKVKPAAAAKKTNKKKYKK